MTVLLRTLTEKSVMPEGTKHEGKTIGDLLTTNKTYLLYSYFNYDRITFVPSVLEQLRIKPEHIITKPGKNPEFYKMYADRNFQTMVRMKTSKVSKENKEAARCATVGW